MRLIFWVAALAVLSIVNGKNSTAKTKPKRQLDSIRSAHSLQYSLVLPNSRVAHFRSLSNNRRISHGAARGGKLPPYAVQMEPVVQYSQKDPLYDPTLDNNFDDSVVNKNEIYAQSKILNTHDSIDNYGPPYGSLPTAPLYSHEPHPHYYEAPEPIIEIIIKESNESLPAPPPPPVPKKKKEPVHVFYVKYSKDPHSHDKVIYEKPIPAITPPTNQEDEHDHHDEYVTVTPEPYIPVKTTTLRAIIKPESEVYHSDSSVKVTFGNEGHHHYSDRREGTQSEGHEESAPRPAIAIPNQQPQPRHPQLERSASPKPQYSHETETKSTIYHPNAQEYRANSQHAQSRIQFQPQSFPTEQQLPRQGPTSIPFKPQPHNTRHPFASPSSLIPNPAFANGPPGIISYSGPTAPTPLGPVFPTAFPRTNPSFHSRPSNPAPPQFAVRPQFNGPPRTSFHSGPQRPFHPPQSKPFFDEAKYLQENYHTITTEQVDPPKEQPLPNRQTPTFTRIPQASPSSPPQFQEHFNRPQAPLTQQLPQQRPQQHFHDPKPSFAVSPSVSPFFNLKPSPPHIENNRPPFQQTNNQQFGFHQGPTPVVAASAIPPLQNQHSFSSPINVSPAPITHQFLPQPSSSPQYNFQPSPSPEQYNFHRLNSPSERPQFQQPQGPSERPLFQQPQGPSERPQFHQPHGPSERPIFFQTQGPSERPAFSQPISFKDHANSQHLQNVGQFVPNGGELIPAIPKYEQHITLNGPTAQPDYSGLSGSSQPQNQHQQQQKQQQYQEQQRHQQQQRQQHEQQQRHHQEQQQQEQQKSQQQEQQQQRHQQEQQQRNQQEQQQRHQQEQQQQRHQQEQQQQRHQQQQKQRQDQEQRHRQEQEQRHRQEQQRQQEQQRHQQAQEQQYQQQQQYDTEQEQVRQQLAQNVKKQQEEIQRLQNQLILTQQYNQQVQATSPRSQYIQERSRPQPSSASPAYYQSTARTVEIKPTTQKYVSSTINSINPTPEPKQEQKKRPAIELPDEVPDDLRQQLLSSGILDNADISVLDYDKVGDTPLDSLPPDQLANFFSAGGAQQIASSENRPVYVKPNGDQIESRMIDEMEEDQEIAASENVPSYAAPPNNQAVEMKVVHFDPQTDEGQKIANQYVQENATQVEPVSLNDKKYNRYLPLKVSGNQFPLPDILKGRKVTSVVVLAPVETEALKEHSRKQRSTSNSLKGIKFVAGDSLQNLLKKPTEDNFKKWLEVEKKTAADLQSIILLVTGNDEPEEEREIFMYDAASGNVNKLSGELSSAFVEAAENNSLSKDIDSLAIEGEGTPENFNKDDVVADGSENVPLFVDLSGVSLDDEDNNHVSISSGYSKTKLGRSLRRH